MLQLIHDSFQVLLASPAEEFQTIPHDVAGVQEDGWLLGDDGAEQELTLDQRNGPEIQASMKLC